MSIQLLLSNNPFLAVVTFKDGTTRQIGYKQTAHDHTFVHFYGEPGDGSPTVMVAVGNIATIELHKAAEPAGAA